MSTETNLADISSSMDTKTENLSLIVSSSVAGANTSATVSTTATSDDTLATAITSAAVNTLKVDNTPTFSTASDTDHIRIRVITTDDTNEVHFRVKEHTRMGRMKQMYGTRMGLDPFELRFMFEGHRVTDDDTPKSLGIVNNDIIELYQERTGGM